MGFFYFDESVHPKGKFTLGAFAYSETSLDAGVADALRQSGLLPRVDEFKSGMRMDLNPKQAHARELLRSIVSDHCLIGVVVAPHLPRYQIGVEALVGLEKILSTNRFESEAHEVFLDQGIFPSANAGERSAENVLNFQRCRMHFEQDSVQVLGLQVSDLIAHTCATMLLAELGIVKKKMVKAGENSGYDANLDIELEVELWAGLRYNFFAAAPPPPSTWESQLDFKVDVASRGLHISERCDEMVRSAALSVFGSMYLGCIH